MNETRALPGPGLFQHRIYIEDQLAVADGFGRRHSDQLAASRLTLSLDTAGRAQVWKLCVGRRPK